MFPQGIKQHLFSIYSAFIHQVYEGKIMHNYICTPHKPWEYSVQREYGVRRTSGVQNGLNQTPALAAEESASTYIWLVHQRAPYQYRSIVIHHLPYVLTHSTFYGFPHQIYISTAYYTTPPFIGFITSNKNMSKLNILYNTPSPSVLPLNVFPYSILMHLSSTDLMHPMLSLGIV